MSMWNFVSKWSPASAENPSDDQEQPDAGASISGNHQATNESQLSDVNDGLDALVISEVEICPISTSSGSSLDNSPKKMDKSPATGSVESFELVSRNVSADVSENVSENVSRKSSVSARESPPNLDIYRSILNAALAENARKAASARATLTEPDLGTSSTMSIDQYADFLLSTYEEPGPVASTSKTDEPSKPGYLTMAALSASNNRSATKTESNDTVIVDAESATSVLSTDVEASTSIADADSSAIEAAEPNATNLLSAVAASEDTPSLMTSCYTGHHICPETIALCRQQINMIPHLKTGTVKWFCYTKGFGFIRDEEGKELFVHKTALKMNGFCYLRSGEKVMFTSRKKQNRPKAQVVDIIGSRLVTQDNQSRSRLSRKMYRCYNCGVFANHYSDTCPRPRQTNLSCYICLSDQHLRADCPSKHIPNARHDQDVLLSLPHVTCTDLNESDTDYSSAADSSTVSTNSETSSSSYEMIENDHIDPGIMDVIHG